MTEKESCTIWKNGEIDPRDVHRGGVPRIFDGNCIGCDECWEAVKSIQDLLNEQLRKSGVKVDQDLDPTSVAGKAQQCAQLKKERAQNISN